MSRLRIKDQFGRTIGFVENEADQIIGSVLLFIAALIIAPIVLVAVGAGWVVLFVWFWGRSIPLTPFPNFNGVLFLAVVITSLWIGCRSLVRGYRQFTKGISFWRQTISTRFFLIIVNIISGSIYAFSFSFIAGLCLIGFSIALVYVGYVIGWLFSSSYLLEFELRDMLQVCAKLASWPGVLGGAGFIAGLWAFVAQQKNKPQNYNNLMNIPMLFCFSIVSPILGRLLLQAIGSDYHVVIPAMNELSNPYEIEQRLSEIYMEYIGWNFIRAFAGGAIIGIASVLFGFRRNTIFQHGLL